MHGGQAMILFFAGFVAALAPSVIALAWVIWVGGIGEDPDQTAQVLPFKRHPRPRWKKAKSA
jgi:hypothetical protein